MFFNFFSLKIYNIHGSVPNWVKFLDPDPNSMYLDPQHGFF